MTPTVLCPSCEQPVPDTQRFCGHCGADVRRATAEHSYDAEVVQGLVEALRRATLGEYEIREELGRGGMAYVFLAHEISLGRKVALKVLAPHLHLVPGMSARFLREAQTAAGLEHPNIIPIYARRETPDVVFFTMRYVAGVTLSALVRQIGPLPIPLVRSLLSDIGSALAFAHAHGVLHRDVKPGNVMVGRDGSVFVTDFGIAKQATGAGLTMTGQLLGTPGYMSPEQCRGHDVAAAADQYSLGAMAFELLAGRPPFLGGNAVEVMAQQMTQPAPDLQSLRPDSPPELTHAVMRMLAKDQTERWGSIEEGLWAAKAVPLAPGDPVRMQLMQWVASPTNARVFSVTPVSPTPRLSDVVSPSPYPLPPLAPAAQPLLAPAVREQVTPPDIGPGPVLPPPDGAEEPRVRSTPVLNVTMPLPWASPPAPPPDDRPMGATASANRTLLAGAGAIALFAVLFFVWRGTRSDRPQVAPAPQVTTSDSGANPAGSIIADSDSTSNGATSTSTGITGRGGDSGTVPPPPPERPTIGTLTLSRFPRGATVRIDGAPMRGTRLELSPGRHTVSVDAPGYRSYDTVVSVGAGGTARLAFNGEALDPPKPEPPKPEPPKPEPPKPEPVGRGVLMVRVRPFARIYVDGKLAVEDERLERELTAGRHALRFEKNGFQTIDTTITIAAGDTLKRPFQLKPSTP